MIQKLEAETQKRFIFIILLIILISSIISFIFIKDSPLLVDEKGHYPQIKKFIDRDFTMHPDITTIPGYHCVIALFAYIFHVSSISAIRLLSLIFSIISILTFFLLSRKIHKESSIVKTLQYYFLPILFPFFFLIYTDVLSLLSILFAFYLLLNEKYKLSGIAGIISILIRQNNIIWLIFMCLFIYFEKYNFEFDFRTIKRYIKDIWVFIIGFIIFLIFLIINRGFALGDRAMHPSFSFHLGNIFFILFCFFFLFLPLNISNFSKIIQYIVKNKKIIIIITFVFLIYIITFVNNHPYNMGGGYFLRNKALRYITSNIFLKILSFIPIAYSILSISVTKLHRKSFYLIYPITLFFLMPSWLIEPRYYLISFTLFILFKKNESKLVEYLTIIIYVIASGILFYWIRTGRFFL